MFDVITIGGATRDIFFELPELHELRGEHLGQKKLIVPYGQKLLAKKSHYTFGGGAVNVAIGLRRLGLKTAASCNLGQEGTGSLLLSELKKEGVNTSLVTRDPKHHTGLSVFVLGDDSDHVGFLERGANDFLKLPKLSYSKKSNWIYLSSLTGKAAENIPHIFDYAQKQGAKIAFNPGIAQLKEGYSVLKTYLEQTEILILNFEEAESLIFTKTKRHVKNQDELVRELYLLGAKIIVVTNSGKGSIALYEGKVYKQKAFSDNVIDTTGAGDAFGSTFLYGVIKGQEIKDCLKIAAINAASVVSEMGAQPGLLTYNEIKKSKWL